DLDLAYVLLRVKDDAGALAMFDGVCAHAMTPASEMDAGYAAQRLVRNPDAIVHFSKSLDLRRTGSEPLDPETEFGIRRSIDSLSREFGLTIGAFYRADRSPAGGGNVGQGIAEAYWQPPAIGNRNGRILQLYSRLSMNALSPGASTVQSSSLQAALGVRYKPLADLNFVGAVERLVPIGATAVKDWLLRAGYSAGFNTDIQPSTHYNMSGQIYGEAAYLTNQDRAIGSIEGRYGIDRRLGPSPNLTGSLYVNGAYNYDSAELRKSSFAAGPGISLKYWFRENQHRAPASYVQVDVMYRFKITPADRTSGLVLQLSTSF
ncbi:MAG: bacteriophage N4 adsorption protein A, partial [Rhodospirillaceae bacterium]|nr:bacteriophage N4 adsorption protein A [Rhodospirillaceae bacterium]